MSDTRILIVDDEPELRGMLRRYLISAGFEVDDVASGSEATVYLKATVPDLVILDVGLPDIDGFEVLRQMRGASDVPVIMLTARADEIDRVVGLSVGADDYVTKPFSPRELVARINAVLRRGRVAEQSIIDVLGFNGFSIDARSRDVSVDGKPVEMSTLVRSTDRACGEPQSGLLAPSAA